MSERNKSEVVSDLLMEKDHMPEANSNKTERPSMFTSMLINIKLTQKWGK